MSALAYLLVDLFSVCIVLLSGSIVSLSSSWKTTEKSFYTVPRLILLSQQFACIGFYILVDCCNFLSLVRGSCPFQNNAFTLDTNQTVVRFDPERDHLCR